MTDDLSTDEVRYCKWCGEHIPLASRSDAKYCCERCRHYYAVDQGRRGTIASVRKLKNGKISVVIYMRKTDLRPGQPVRVGLDV